MYIHICTDTRIQVHERFLLKLYLVSHSKATLTYFIYPAVCPWQERQETIVNTASTPTANAPTSTSSHIFIIYIPIITIIHVNKLKNE